MQDRSTLPNFEYNTNSQSYKQKLEEVLQENHANLAAKQFIDAHFQEIVALFKDAGDGTIFRILIRIDPNRTALYEEFVP